MPFRSAELKDLAERAWGLGAQVTASTLARWFRAGELKGLVDYLAYVLDETRALQDRITTYKDMLTYAKQYQDHCVQRIHHYYNVRQEWFNRIDEYQQQLDAARAACIHGQIIAPEAPETKAVCQKATWLATVAIPTAEKNYADARANELFWRDEFRRIRHQIPLLENTIQVDSYTLQQNLDYLREKWRMVL